MISAGPRFRSPVGVLADGTPYYAPVGEVIMTSALVTCHLCGRSLRSVTAHLRTHGWTKLDYCEAFGLERSQSLEGPETRKLRAAALAARLVFEPAMREGSAAGRQRARAGDLTRVPPRRNPRRRPALPGLGSPAVPCPRGERHVAQHGTGNGVAGEAARAPHGVGASLRRQGFAGAADGGKRHGARQGAAETAARL